MQVWGTLKKDVRRSSKANRHCWTLQGRGMMGTLRHFSMVMHVAVKELRRAPITMITLEITREGIINLIIPEWILIIKRLITKVVNHGFAKRVIFCGLNNHVISKCWKRMVAERRMRHGKPSPQQGKKSVKKVFRRKTFCTHCDQSGNQRATCWRLHLEQRLKYKVLVHTPIEKANRQASSPQGNDPLTLVSERWFF